MLNNELKRLGRERFESEQLRTNLPALDKHYDWRCRIMIMMTRRRGMVMMVMVMVDKLLILRLPIRHYAGLMFQPPLQQSEALLLHHTYAALLSTARVCKPGHGGRVLMS